MTNDDVKEFVEVSLINNPTQLYSSDHKRYKCRVIFGYKVVGTRFFHWEKYGQIFEISHEEEFNKTHDKTYNYFLTKVYESTAQKIMLEKLNPEKKKSLKLYGYHFGMDYTIDENGDIQGYWPLVATMNIFFEDVFL